MPSSHLILWCPLLLLPSIFSNIRDFSSEKYVYIRWPKYCSFSFSISPSSEYSGLISLKIDWFDLLAVQRTFRSLLQYYSSKASILWHSASLQSCSHNCTWPLGRLYGLALTIWTFFGRVMSLVFNKLSRFVIHFPAKKQLSGCSHHLQWFWSPTRGNLSLLPHFPFLFAMQWWDRRLVGCRLQGCAELDTTEAT